jgi:hypothetical protein
VLVAGGADDRLARALAEAVHDYLGAAALHVHLEIDLGEQRFEYLVAHLGVDAEDVGEGLGLLAA